MSVSCIHPRGHLSLSLSSPECRAWFSEQEWETTEKGGEEGRASARVIICSHSRDYPLRSHIKWISVQLVGEGREGNLSIRSIWVNSDSLQLIMHRCKVGFQGVPKLCRGACRQSIIRVQPQGVWWSPCRARCHSSCWDTDPKKPWCGRVTPVMYNFLYHIVNPLSQRAPEEHSLGAVKGSQRRASKSSGTLGH